MKKTWMVSLSKNFFTLKILELYFYFYFLNKFFFLYSLSSLQKFKFFSTFIKFNFLALSTKKKLNSLNDLKKFPRHLNLTVNHKFLIDPISPQLTLDFSNKPYHFKNLKSTHYRFISLFFLFNYSLFNSNFKINYNFKLFYITDVNKQVVIFNLKKFFKRWKDAYDLLFNVFYYNTNPVIFGSPFFKQEICSLNWYYNNWSVGFWRYYFPFFTFKLNNYNRKTSFFFDKIGEFGINFYLITDCFYHFKNLYYLKKKNYYTIGLVNVNLNPWIVSYPIVSFFESLLTQSFFFKLLLFIEKQTYFYKYSNFKKIWLSFLINKQAI